jgi:hypothetical protein
VPITDACMILEYVKTDGDDDDEYDDDDDDDDDEDEEERTCSSQTNRQAGVGVTCTEWLPVLPPPLQDIHVLPELT